MTKEIKIAIADYPDSVQKIIRKVFKVGVAKFIEIAYSKCNSRRRQWAIEKNDPKLVLQSAIEDEIDRIASETLPEEVYMDNVFEKTFSLEDVAEDITHQIADEIDLEEYLSKRVYENLLPDLTKSKLHHVLQTVFKEFMEKDSSKMLREDLDPT